MSLACTARIRAAHNLTTSGHRVQHSQSLFGSTVARTVRCNIPAQHAPAIFTSLCLYSLFSVFVPLVLSMHSINPTVPIARPQTLAGTSRPLFPVAIIVPHSTKTKKKSPAPPAGWFTDLLNASATVVTGSADIPRGAPALFLALTVSPRDSLHCPSLCPSAAVSPPTTYTTITARASTALLWTAERRF